MANLNARFTKPTRKTFLASEHSHRSS